MMRLLMMMTILLGGCATATPPVCAPDIGNETRHPPAECMLECDPLTPPAGPSLAQTYQAGIGAALNQKECARRHACLVQWVSGK